MIEEYMINRQAKKRWQILALFVVAIYFTENSRLASIIGLQFFNYIIKPGLWIIIGVFTLYLPNKRYEAKLRQQSLMCWWAFNFGIIYIIALVLGGIADGYGKSPYNQSLRGVLVNILVVASSLVGRELIRSYILHDLTNKENYYLMISIAFLFAISNISMKRIQNLQDFKNIVQFCAQYLAPELTQNILATYLAFMGGALPAIIYMGVLQAFHWFSPVLPNLQWITEALIGIMVPLFSFMSIHEIYDKETGRLKRKENDEGILSWMLTSLFSIAIIWFVVGVFPIYPSAIATGSMEPIIKPGDVIIVKKITDIEAINSLKIGDIIQFKRDSILISHRIIEVQEGEAGISFKTKGDNNSAIDQQPVKPENIKGRIIKVVPKVGWPTLFLKQRNNLPSEPVVF